MISVEEAWERILGGIEPLKTETVSVMSARGRTLARDAIAKCTTPSHDTSAMDGYAVRHADLKKMPSRLKVLGEAPAGTLFKGQVKAGQAVRIFTGGIVPNGADTVVIQENTRAEGNTVTVESAPEKGRNIRKAGMDFRKGDVLVKGGTLLNERDIALIAGGNNGETKVFRRPRVALLANGDELVAPGGKLNPGAVVNSNTPALKALIETAGAEVAFSEIIPDNLEALTKAFQMAGDFDLIITLGGASVGDYDYVLQAFEAAGGVMDFWKIAMKPGKPLMFGELGDVPVLGLPGNPNSAYVTAFLFALPVLRRLQGQKEVKPESFPGRAGDTLPETLDREVFVLSALEFSQKNGGFVATPHPKQDSARMSTLKASQALIHRKPFSKAAKAGDLIEVLPLP